jgi:dephospho-CoA kinase
LVATKSDIRIAGLTGRNASGKGEAARILRKLGYQYRSLSDIVREEAAARQLPSSRENLIAIANELRRRDGPGVLAARTVPLLAPGNHVIDSIRHPAEVEILRHAGALLLIAVDAPIELRFARARGRGRDESAGTLDEFRTMEDRERTRETNAQQLDATFELADHVVVNDKDLKDFERELLRVLSLGGFPTHSKNSATDPG